eukprot:11800632-Alexandrium_andersonii.AAC.1
MCRAYITTLVAQCIGPQLALSGVPGPINGQTPCAQEMRSRFDLVHSRCVPLRALRTPARDGDAQ